MFDRIYTSRDPFWTTLQTGGRASDVYISNNRRGIYAVGHQRFTMFDHAVRLAEIVAILGAAFLAWLVLLTLVQPFTRERYRLGRELARELRVSFYRRLFLAFVVIAVAPVLVLAAIIRNNSTTQLRADIEAGAARTAITAQRVIDELERAGGDPGPVVTDDLLVFVSQILDQDVHIYGGAQLLATSQRDLFASGLLPARTPAAVYGAIALAGAPQFCRRRSDWSAAVPGRRGADPFGRSRRDIDYSARVPAAGDRTANHQSRPRHIAGRHTYSSSWVPRVASTWRN